MVGGVLVERVTGASNASPCSDDGNIVSAAVDATATVVVLTGAVGVGVGVVEGGDGFGAVTIGVGDISAGDPVVDVMATFVVV